MRILLVIPLHTQSEKAESIPLGSICIASRVKKNYDCVIIDMNTLVNNSEKPNVNALINRTTQIIITSYPNIVGFTCLCNSFHITLKVAKLVKALCPESTIVLGGPHTTAIHHDIIENFPFVDAVIIGESDDSITKFVRWIELRKKGLPPLNTFVRGVPYPSHYPIPCLPKLDDLPIPLYEMLSPTQYEQLNPLRKDLLISIDAGRGCPFSCAFCATREVWSKPRQKSPERLLYEMWHLYKLFNKSKFRLIHDSFIFQKDAIEKFLDFLIAENKHFEWGCSIKPDLLDNTLIDRFIAAGCRGMFFGIESAAHRIQKLIDKIMDMTRIVTNVKYALSRGLGITTSFIIGFPFETEEDIQETLNFHKSMCDFGVTKSMVNMLCPLPASRLCRSGYSLSYDGFPPNLSDPAWMFDAESDQLIRQYPKIFSSFYKYDLQYTTHEQVAGAFFVANQYACISKESGDLILSREKECNQTYSGNRGR